MPFAAKDNSYRPVPIGADKEDPKPADPGFFEVAAELLEEARMQGSVKKLLEFPVRFPHPDPERFDFPVL